MQGRSDRVFPVESTHLAELFAGSGCVNAAFKKWLQTCDLAVGWLQDVEATIADSLQALGVQRVRIQSPSSPALLSEHQAARYLETLERESGNLVEGNALVLSSSTREKGRELLETLKWSQRQRLVVLHVGSGSMHKCLGPSQWAAILAWLHREGTFPLMLEGPSDGEPVARVQATLGRYVPVIRDCTLSAVAGVLSHADCYLGHDSGVTHPCRSTIDPHHRLFWSHQSSTLGSARTERRDSIRPAMQLPRLEQRGALRREGVSQYFL